MIGRVLEKNITNMTYDQNNCKELSANISVRIREQLKDMCGNQDLFKVAVHTFIAELQGEGVETSSQYSWEPGNDCVVCGYLKNDSLMAMVNVFIGFCPD